MSVQLEKILIKIGENEIPLRLEEAKELLHVLRDLLETEGPTKYVRSPQPDPYRWRGPYWSAIPCSTTSITRGVSNGGTYTITSRSSGDGTLGDPVKMS